MRHPLGVWLVALLACAGCAGATVADHASEPTARAASTSTAEPARAPVCAPNDDRGRLTIWSLGGGNLFTSHWSASMSAYTAEHGVTFDLQTFDNDRQILDRLAVTPPDDWPDLVLVSEQARRNLVDSHRFLHPTDCDASFGDDMLPLLRATYTVDGDLVALPFGVSVPVLMYDSTEFTAAGLDATHPPTTLTALLDASQRIRQSGVSPSGLALSDGCGSYVVEQLAAQRGSVELEPSNGHQGTDVTVTLATPENVAALTALRDGVRAGHVKYIGQNNSNFDDLVQLSPTDGTSTMTIHTSGAVGDVLGLLEGGNFPGAELGVGPMPGTASGSLIGGNSLWLVDHHDPRRAGLAAAFLHSLYAPANLAALAAATGYVPVTKAAATQQVLLDAWAAHPQLKVAYDQVLSTPVNDATAGPVLGSFDERNRDLFAMCTDIMSGGADVAAALRTTSDLMNEQLAAYAAAVSHGDWSLSDMTTDPVPTGTAVEPTTVTGVVSCRSGAPVPGIWVEPLSATPGWAEFVALDDGRYRYTFVLSAPSAYSLHVGCGTDATGNWATANYTPNVTGTDLTFECVDDGLHDPGTCVAVD